MSLETYTVEVQQDFIQRQSKADPVKAVSELIWNSLDADADSINIRLDYGDLGMSGISIKDNGEGMPRDDAIKLFTRLGGSWKKPGARTKRRNRLLHGHEGRGRFKAFSLGRVVDWRVVYCKGGSLYSYTISMIEANIREVKISKEEEINGVNTGVEVYISELHKHYKSLEEETAQQTFSEIFALYLKDYSGISVYVNGYKLDPSSAISKISLINLEAITDNTGSSYPVQLEIVEWKSATQKALYLCSDEGFPLTQVSSNFHTGDFQFSSYLKSAFITKLHAENMLELAELDSELKEAIEKAKLSVKGYFRDRSAEIAKAVVDQWKNEDVYPYEGEVENHIQDAERKVFDIVAVTASNYMPNFSGTPKKQKAMHLRMLKSAIEKSPDELQLILTEVLNLPKRKQNDLAELLKETTLSSIISAAKVVSDRLNFLNALEQILFDLEMKSRLKERSQLHQIIADNTWIFGEEYHLSVSDQSLTRVLKKHKKLLKNEITIDEPVKHITKKRGIVDLMLSRTLRRHRSDELDHLVVELKRPKQKIRSEEIVQTEEYAIAVANDERFKKNNGVRWTFWVVSDDIDSYAEHRITNDEGIVSDKNGIVVGIKTWGQIIESNRARLQFFQEKLEHQVDEGSALRKLQEKYQQFLEGVVNEHEPDNKQSLKES